MIGNPGRFGMVVWDAEGFGFGGSEDDPPLDRIVEAEPRLGSIPVGVLLGEVVIRVTWRGILLPLVTDAYVG